MKIALFHNLPFGGAKRATYELIKILSNNHDIDLYLNDMKTESFLGLSKYTSNTYSFDYSFDFKISLLNKFYKFISLFFSSLKISSKINNSNYDVALVMQCHAFNSPLLLRYLKIPVLYYCQEPLTKLLEPHYNNAKFFKKLYINTLIKMDKKSSFFPTVIAANSMYSVENIYRSYGRYPKLNYLGVNTSLFKPNLTIKKDNSIILVGSLNSSKGQDFVIQSVATMKVKPTVKFIYNFSYGDKDYLNKLKLDSKKFGINMVLINMASDEDLVKEYNKSKLTVFTSRLEPLGLVPLESMACGTPVIGVSEGGIRETINNNINGITTERDPVLFGKAITKLISDKDLWDLYRDAGLKSVREKWTWESSTSILESNLNLAIDTFNKN